MKKIFTNILTKLAMVAVLATAFAGSAWGQTTTYEQLTSISNIDETAQYVLGIDGTGFHYEGTSSWGKTALPSAQTPLFYTLKKASDGNSFTAETTISGAKYYLQVPTSNTFSMATSTGTNTDLIIGTTQVSGTNYAVANKTTTSRHLRINGTSGLRSYAGTTGSMAFFYKVVTSGGSNPTTYTVTYNANGGTGTMTDSKSPYSAGATVSVLENTFTKNGFSFDKWNTAANGSGTDYDEGDTFTINANTTLYAQWTVDNTGGSSVVLTQSNLELTGSYSSDASKTIGGITFVHTDLMKNNDNIQAKASTGTIKNTTAFPGDITSVSITHSGTARATTINGSADGNNWTQVATGSGSITADFTGKGYKYFQITRGSNAAYWEMIEIAYSESSSSLSNSDLAISNASTDLAFDLYNNATAQVITYTTSSTGAITITPASPTSYFSYVHDASAKTITVTPLAETTSAQTVTISQAADDSYYAGTATFTVSVTNSDPNKPGSQNAPYTVAQARAAIDAETGVTGVYATGIVSEIVTAYNSQYGNISYNISADGTTSADQLQAYRGKSYNGDNFTSADDIKVGDEVVVYGNLIKHESTYEFAADNQLVSLDRPVHPIINASDVTIEHDATSGEIAYTVDNPSTGVTLGATTTADWISNIAVTADKVTFTTTPNDGDADRTATITLTYTGATDKEVTVTQKHFVIDFATLPFAYDGNGTGDLPAGFTVSGLGTYSSSPAMKFDDTGDYAILKINERPGILTFDIKGNSFSGGTFKVQTSEDGITYSDLETYTQLGSTQSESFDDLGENVRYIKWIYTNKSSGNVALGNIKLEVYVPIVKHTVSWTAGANTELFVFAGDQSTTINSGAEVAEGTTVWISIDVASGYVFDALTVKDANNSDVTLTEETPGSYYSFTMPTSNVTITSSAVAEPPVPVSDWVLTDIGDLTADDVFIIVGDNGDTFALSNNNGTTNPPAAVAVAVSGTKWTGAVADNLKWNISGNATDGYTFYPNGSTTTWLYCTNTNNGVRVGDSDNKLFVISAEGYLKNSANSRYVGIYDSSDWRCYTSINDNIKDQTFSFYKLDVPVAQNEIIIPAAENNGQYWASFFCSLAGYTISEGAKAFTMNASNQLYLLGEGNVIPANTAVIIISDTDTITLTKTDSASASVSGGANILVGSDSDTAASGITGTPYVLSIVNNTLGFYQFTGTIPANKAYYIVNE